MAVDIVSDFLLQNIRNYALRRASDSVALWLRLFMNPLVIGPATPLASFTELNAPGYAAYSITMGIWQVTDTSGQPTGTYPAITWPITGQGPVPATIYGHYVTNVGPTQWYWAQAWAVPYVLPVGGAQITVQLNWQNRNC